MGNLTSSIHSDNHFKEIFMISYMNRHGPTPQNWDLLPGGSLKDSDDDAVARHKFKMALKKQAMLSQMLHGIDRKVTRCLSPCLLTDFSLEGPMRGGNMFDYTWSGDEEKIKIQANAKSKTKIQVQAPPPAQRGKGGKGDLGSLERLVSTIYPMVESAEEIAAYDVVRQPLRGSAKEKRARSRPERTSRAASDQRQVLSVTEVRQDSLSPIQEAVSEVLVEKIELGGKRSRKCWPPKEVVQRVMKDSKNRPHIFFLGRFRSPHHPDPVEVEYRFHKQTLEESFTYKGNLELLLPEEGRCKYQVDKFNNNLDEKAIFFQNLPFFFNNYCVRIFWNGFIMLNEGPVSQRMTLETVELDPPTLFFDMSGLKHISASRNQSKMNITGNNDEGDGAFRSFAIRGRNETDMKEVKIDHAPGTAIVSVTLPLLSSAASSKAELGVSENSLGQAQHKDNNKLVSSQQ